MQRNTDYLFTVKRLRTQNVKHHSHNNPPLSSFAVLTPPRSHWIVSGWMLLQKEERLQKSTTLPREQIASIEVSKYKYLFSYIQEWFDECRSP